MYKTTWKRADPALRAQLEALLEKPDGRWLYDLNEAAGWWLLLEVICVCGLVGTVWDTFDSTSELDWYRQLYASNPSYAVKAFATRLQTLGFIASLVVGILVARAWIQNLGRRGLALVDDAIVLVRGRKLVVFPLSAIEGAERESVRARAAFTIIRLKLKDGRRKTLYAHGGWADLAMAKILAA